MSRKKEQEEKKSRISEIRDQILNIDHICTGTLLSRTKVCGKPGCRCAKDPAARHGPYYEWSRRREGKLVHSIISKETAEKIGDAINNRKTILRLLGEWERETTRIILGEKARN